MTDVIVNNYVSVVRLDMGAPVSLPGPYPQVF